jgi:uncharacterized protein (DUF1684 family)
MLRNNIFLLITLLLTLMTSACNEPVDPVIQEYIASIAESRAENNAYMETNPNSPFNFKGKVEFHDLNYFDVDPAFKFKSKLYEFDSQDTVIIFGTKGDERKIVRHGYVIFNHEGAEIQINVYEGQTRTGDKYHSIWFTDKTTNEESYGVGRYLNFEKVDEPDYLYEIDFNNLYNPYCAYSKEYSCAIPTKEDYIDIAIYAGEKKFHD